ncbi:MAG: glycosyltransferase [Planctomycetota bacterium]
MSVTDKNILFMTGALSGGGLENRFCRLAPRMLAAAKSRRLVCLTALDKDVYVEGLPVASLGYRGPWHYPRAALRLARIIRREEIDLVYAVTRCANVVAHLARRLTRRPFKLVLGANSQAGRQFDLHPTLTGLFWQKVSAHIYRQADLVTCNSHWAMDELVSRFRVRATDIRVLGNPLPEPGPSAVRPPGTLPPLPARYILCATRLVDGKGLKELLDAFAAIADRTEEHLVIAGDGPLRAQLHAQCDSLGIAPRVHFLGWMDDLWPLYRQCSFFVTASYTEGMPNAVLEAMGAGAAVISAESTSWIGLFAQQAACLAVPPADVPALTEAMLTLADSPEARQRLRTAAAQVVSQFTLDKIVAQFDQVLTGVLDSPLDPRDDGASPQ